MYDSDYVDSTNYENEPSHSSTMVRFRRKQFFYTALFLIGTLIAAIGWYVEWKGIFKFSFEIWVPIAGHALQVIGAFGSLMTPDYIEEEE